MSRGDAAELVRDARERLEASPDEAIRRFRDAVALLKRVRTPEEAATKAAALSGLGRAYMARRAGTRADDVEQAIRWYGEALDFLYARPFRGTADDRLIGESDRVRALLAIAYDQRVLGSREGNLGRILVHTDSVDLDDEADTELRATTLMLRGKAYRDRGDAEGLGVMDQSIALHFFRDALRQLEGREGTELWAEVHLEIGRTLLRTAAGRDETPWTDAAEHFREALDRYAGLGRDVEVATVHEQLGQYHARRDREAHEAGAREEARDHFALALRHLSPDQHPEEWARIQTATARLALGDDMEDLDVALPSFASALDALTRPEHAETRLEVLAEPAYLLLLAGRWAEAAAMLEEALELALALVKQADTMAGQWAAASDIANLAHGLAYCRYRMGDLDDALLALESGRARLLAETLRWSDHDDAALTATERRRLARINRRIRKLESAHYGGMRYIEDSDRLEALRKRRDAMVDGFRHGTPARPEISRIAPDEPGTALVVPLVTPAGSALFVLAAGDRHVAPDNVLELPGDTAAEIDRWLAGDETRPGWLAAYEQRNEGTAQHELWRATMREVCGDLWDTVAAGLLDRLRELGISRITFVPTAGLQFLPLHAAAPREADGARCLMDDVTVAYAPSAYVLAVSKRRAAARAAKGPALLVGVTRYEDLPALPSIADELAMVATTLQPSTPLLDERASRKRVLRLMSGASIVHLACHGAGWALGGAMFRMSWTPPPVLRLWDDGLSFQDLLLRDLRSVRLVCLSACDTGLVDTSLPWDEFEGLANVFLRAGAAAVVSSLWAVDDRSTALLMQRFYANLAHHGQDPAAALRAAQLWLRNSTRASLAAVYEKRLEEGHEEFMDAYTELMLGGDPGERPYAHPFYWAPFTLTGQ
ncbi:CHAT domain-containing protein [Nonomuraea jabiensis]|uniref:CHAT domain-containing protein n=1 Tax=Nonomuraea jabiensis TaxID=882448 RepID=UPI003D729005